MSKKKGICHICGKGDKLSDEHSTPRSAGNTKPVIRIPLTKILGDGRIDFSGRTDMRGLYYRSLCEECNGKTGEYYVPSFSKFCHDGLTLTRMPNQIVTPIIEIYPLRIIKQIFVIFCSISSAGWIEIVNGLREYLLEPQNTNIDYNFNIFIYRLKGSKGRSVGGCLIGDSRNLYHYIAEFSFPPYGFVLTEDNYKPDTRLYDITSFKNYRYNDKIDNFELKLVELPNPSVHVLDFGQKRYPFNYSVYGNGVDIHKQIQ